jgi:hypothetical protein
MTLITTAVAPDDSIAVFEEHELLRTPEQDRAYSALHGDGGLTSWQRIISSALPENRASILSNALVELYPLARRAAVDHTEIADWAVHIGELYEVGDPDELQRITAAAKESTENSPTSVAPISVIPSTRLRPLDLREFLKLAIKPREMLLDPILPEKGLAMLYAARGTGKTHVALGIAFAIATGTKFLKWTAPKPRRVLLIDGEMPAAALQERLASIIASTPELELDPANIR